MAKSGTNHQTKPRVESSKTNNKQTLNLW